MVSTLHNVRTDVGAGLEDRVKDRLETTALRRWVDVVIGCGPAVAESNRGRVGGSPMVVVPNPVRQLPMPTSADRERLRRELPGDGDELLVAVGRLTEQKDYPNLLRAMVELDERRNSIRLVVVGEGEDRAALDAEIARQDLADRVFLVGNRPDVPAILSAADVFVLSSAWEGLPLVLLEAMAVGAPIVATDVGDVRGVVGETAAVVAPADHRALAGAIAALLDDPGKATGLGSAARERVRERHSSRAWVDQLRSVYEQALQR